MNVYVVAGLAFLVQLAITGGLLFYVHSQLFRVYEPTLVDLVRDASESTGESQ